MLALFLESQSPVFSKLSLQSVGTGLSAFIPVVENEFHDLVDLAEKGQQEGEWTIPKGIQFTEAAVRDDHRTHVREMCVNLGGTH
jgi:hypothetical protein